MIFLIKFFTMAKKMIFCHKSRYVLSKLRNSDSLRETPNMGNKPLQRQVKFLTEKEQRQIIWELAIEFRQIVVSGSQMYEGGNISEVIAKANTLKVSISNILDMASRHFQPKQRKSLERIIAMLEEFLMTHAVASYQSNILSAYPTSRVA